MRPKKNTRSQTVLRSLSPLVVKYHNSSWNRLVVTSQSTVAKICDRREIKDGFRGHRPGTGNYTMSALIYARLSWCNNLHWVDRIKSYLSTDPYRASWKGFILVLHDLEVVVQSKLLSFASDLHFTINSFSLRDFRWNWRVHVRLNCLACPSVQALTSSDLLVNVVKIRLSNASSGWSDDLVTK